MEQHAQPRRPDRPRPRRRRRRDDPIDELAAAATLKSELDELTDALLGHFVDQARRAGRSRGPRSARPSASRSRPPSRSTRSTESTARQLLARLLPERRWQSASWPGSPPGPRRPSSPPRRRPGPSATTTSAPSTCCSGLFAEPEGIAAKVLGERRDRPATRSRPHVLGIVGRGDGRRRPGTSRSRPRAKQALELALQRGARSSATTTSAPSTMLLGLLREGDGRRRPRSWPARA